MVVHVLGSRPVSASERKIIKCGAKAGQTDGEIASLINRTSQWVKEHRQLNGIINHKDQKFAHLINRHWRKAGESKPVVKATAMGLQSRLVDGLPQ